MKNYQEMFNNGEEVVFDKPTIILASKSPRRTRMMQNSGLDFITLISSVDDTNFNYNYQHYNVSKKQNADYAKQMSILKLQPFVNKIKNGAVITSDTSAWCGGEILEKPITKEKCRLQHQYISGKTTYVYTSISVCFNGKIVSEVLECKVKIGKLSEGVIQRICNEDETLDAAGYRIEGEIGKYAKVEGDINVVIGLCVKTVKKLLNKVGFK
ncbi:MAG: Maf family protein [Firmicutes bacterium]|nr:Maf family protein [Bacillota bacterium]